MKTEPIRDTGKVKAIIKYLDKHSYPRDAMLFRMGVNTALRVSDLLKLRYCDIINEKGDFMEYVNLREQKTKKTKKIALNGKIKPKLKDYCSGYELFGNDYLFFSYKNPTKAIDRIQAWRVLTPAAKYCGIENFGCHSMRKTLAYQIYKETKNLALVMHMLNHQSSKQTMRYIGINQDEMDNVYKNPKFQF